MPIERTDHYFHLDDRDLVFCLQAFDYCASDDALETAAGPVWKRMLLEAKRRGLQSPEHRLFVSAWIAVQIEAADA